MATKTITIDMKAYEALRRRKKEGQSFSDVIKEHFTGGVTGSLLKERLPELTLHDETLDCLDRLVEGRGADEARAPEL